MDMTKDTRIPRVMAEVQNTPKVRAVLLYMTLKLNAEASPQNLRELRAWNRILGWGFPRRKTVEMFQLFCF